MTGMDLPARLARSDREAQLALRELYERTSAKLFASLRARRVTPADAAEIVQETFLKTWAARQDLPADVNLEAYVWCMARNAWIDRYRHDRKIRDRQARDTEVAQLLEAQAVASATSGTVSAAPDSEVFVNCLERAFESYRREEPERAHAIELVAVQGFDHHQLSAALGKTRGAAREFLSQARQAFERLYQQLCGDPA